MITLDACTTFCAALSETIGPTLTELIMIAAAAAFAWWRSRVAIRKVEAKSDAAQQEARDAKLQLAEIKGSLRPSGLAPSSGTSGTFAPVVMPEIQPGAPGRPSVTNPELLGESPLPGPPDLPTIPAKPRSKG